jgi:hypothetical protein
MEAALVVHFRLSGLPRRESFSDDLVQQHGSQQSLSKSLRLGKSARGTEYVYTLVGWAQFKAGGDCRLR